MVPDRAGRGRYDFHWPKEDSGRLRENTTGPASTPQTLRACTTLCKEHGILCVTSRAHNLVAVMIQHADQSYGRGSQGVKGTQRRSLGRVSGKWVGVMGGTDLRPSEEGDT